MGSQGTNSTNNDMEAPTRIWMGTMSQYQGTHGPPDRMQYLIGETHPFPPDPFCCQTVMNPNQTYYIAGSRSPIMTSYRTSHKHDALERVSLNKDDLRKKHYCLQLRSAIGPAASSCPQRTARWNRIRRVNFGMYDKICLDMRSTS